MPLGLGSNPFLSAGAGSTIPISAGGGTSGPAVTGDIGPISIGGLFSSDAMGSSGVSPQTLLLIAGAAIAGLILLKKL